MKKEFLDNILEFMAAAMEEEPETEVLGTLTPEELAKVDAAAKRIADEKERVKNIIEDEAKRLREEMAERLEKFVDAVDLMERDRFNATVKAAKADLHEVIGRYTDNPESIHIHKDTGKILREVEPADE